MAVLTEEQYLYLQDEVVRVAYDELVMRRVMFPVGVSKGKQIIGYNKLTDMSAAEIVEKFDPGTYDTIDLTRKTKDIKRLKKGFTFSREDLFASEEDGEPLDTLGAELAARQVAALEDDMILNGKSNFSVKGITDVANQTNAAGAVWSAATEANNPYADILTAQANLNNKGFEARFVLCDPVNYGELAKKVTNSGGTWMELVKNNVTPNVLKSSALTHGTVIVGDMGKTIARLYYAEDMVLLDANIPDAMVYNFNVLDRVIPIFFEYDPADGTADKSDAYNIITGC